MGETITKELLAAVRDGDHSAFEQLFVASFSKVKYFIKGLVKSEEDAEELAQEIFIKLWMNRASIDSERNISTYLYISARNATINFIRKKNVRQSFLNDQIAEMLNISKKTVENQLSLAIRELREVVKLLLLFFS